MASWRLLPAFHPPLSSRHGAASLGIPSQRCGSCVHCPPFPASGKGPEAQGPERACLEPCSLCLWLEVEGSF